MLTLLAYCPHCRSLFEIRDSGAFGPNIMVIQSMTECPNCNRVVPILDGTYAAAGDIVRILQAPSTTLDVLRKIQRSLSLVQSGKVQIADVVDDIEEIHPAFGKWLAQKGVDPSFIAATTILSLLLTVVGLLISALQSNDRIDEKLLIDRIVHQINEQKPRDTNQPPVPKPKPSKSNVQPKKSTTNKSLKSKPSRKN